jgi:SAM-dependent methyltransferase
VPDDLATAIAGAWAYEQLHVNALFHQWTGPLLDAGHVAPGDSVLDVACGTGILAREALDRVAPTGSVTGLDIGPGMLTVAEEIEPRVTWLEGDATRLPFDDDHFDAVVSQFGLMFFPDRAQAIGEMLRCTKPGHRIAVAVWDSLERSQAYPITVDLLQRRAGPAAADALCAPFVLGDTEVLKRLFDDAGASALLIETRHGTARFPSVRSMVEADLRGWLPIMGVFLDDDLIELILAEAEDVLREYVQPDGTMTFDAPAHIVTAQA